MAPNKQQFSGKIYIAASSDKQANNIFKVNCTFIPIKDELILLKKSEPNIKILNEYDCKFANYAKTNIYMLWNNYNLRVQNTDYFRQISLERCNEFVRDVINFSDNLMSKAFE